MTLLNFVLGTVALSLVIYILIIGQSILVPFVASLIIWYLIISLTEVFQKLKIPMLKHRLKRWIALTLAILSCLLVLFFISLIINNSISQVIKEAPKYQTKMMEIIDKAERFLNFDILGDGEIGVMEIHKNTKLLDTNYADGKEKGLETPYADPGEIEAPDSFLSNLDFVGFFSKVAQATTSIGKNMFIILVYVLFLLIETRSFNDKLKAMINDSAKYNSVKNTLSQIALDINKYLKLKTLISLGTGVLSYIALKVIGVDFAEFWAFLIFILNYIPIIGSAVAVVFPIILALVQFPTIYPFIAVTISLLLIQTLMGQIIEPRVTGDSLNLSPIVILLSLALWGTIWGVVGAILCVPIMVIINIVLAKFEKTRWVAALLSAKGKI